ncbi:MAG: inositol monophosphatase [Deltaproteobacteria bacterium]|nr:inositol monophosphatase [Deltaproteobacteria bacterium]MBW2333772.1 inositol monophosphatase [Deltaproteobacteria bacterium]
MKDLKECAIEIAREAGIFLKDKLNSVHTIDYKGEINLVTEVDKISEEMITSKINALFPDHDILAEEFTDIDRGSDFRWIIDPLDGTTNYAHGYPYFCVSIALERLNTMTVGIVYDPMLDEMFVAEKGKGAFLNDREIHVSNTRGIIKSLLATGFPYDIREDSHNNLNYFNEMILEAQAIRRAGSAALDLAYVAAGRFDGFWELKLNPWDIAAGWLLVEEAGGIITDMGGNDYHLESSSILASNGRIHKEMMDVLKWASSI